MSFINLRSTSYGRQASLNSVEHYIIQKLIHLHSMSFGRQGGVKRPTIGGALFLENPKTTFRISGIRFKMAGFTSLSGRCRSPIQAGAWMMSSLIPAKSLSSMWRRTTAMARSTN